MKTLRQVFREYRQLGQALPAFNIDSFEIYQAVEQAVTETNLPCIVQLSPNEDKFIHAERLLMLVKKAQIDGLPIFLNIDHGKDINRLEKLLKLGFDMVHFDGSSLPFEENLSLSKNLVGTIHQLYPEKLIEVEFNQIHLVSSSPSPDSFTNPSQAQTFISQTEADLLAVSIGNLHGVNTDIPENLDLNLFQEITQKLPSTQLYTLHGGSGVDEAQVHQAISLGVVKININTQLRLQFRQSLTSQLQSNNSEKIYEYLDPVISDLKTLIINNLQKFAIKL